MRFAAIVEEDEDGINGKSQMDRTPLRTKVLGERTDDTAENENAADVTPVFLRRTTSFNQRLLTASGSTSQKSGSGPGSNLVFGSPSASRRGPLKRPFKGRGLSEMLRGLRQMEDDDDEDEMDALRELEGNDVNILVGDSQSVVKSSAAEEMPAKIWKKKGQKRTTRRVIMRPTTTQRKSRETEVGEEDQRVVDGEVLGVEETQGLAPADELHAEFGESEDDLLALAESHQDEGNTTAAVTTNCENNQFTMAEAEAEHEEDQEQDQDPDQNFTESDYDDLAPPPKSKLIPPTKEHAITSHPPTKRNTKSKTKQEPPSKAKQKGTTNPNAVSHMNFRSLKIRNRNSKAGGGGGGGKGRFGRGRR